MTDKRPSTGRPDDAFDTMEGHSGQDYPVERERTDAARGPSGGVRSTVEPGDPATGLPSEAGRRASFDPATGEVHGSGSGAGGGGNAGEDYDSDAGGGSG